MRTLRTLGAITAIATAVATAACDSPLVVDDALDVFVLANAGASADTMRFFTATTGERTRYVDIPGVPRFRQAVPFTYERTGNHFVLDLECADVIVIAACIAGPHLAGHLVGDELQLAWIHQPETTERWQR